MSGEFTIASIQPLGSTGLNGAVPRDKAPAEVIELFLGKSFTREELVQMGVHWKDTFCLYTYGNRDYLLNVSTTSERAWQEL